MPFARWLPNFLLALGGCALLFTFHSPALAEECFPLETIQAQIEHAQSFRILDGEKRIRAGLIFNVVTNSEAEWHSAYVLVRPDGLLVLLVGHDGTVCDGFVVGDKDSIQFLLEIIDGVTA